MDIILPLFIVLGLFLLNGFFSGAEIAIISLRKSRTQSLIDEGNKRAHIIQKLQNNPDSFFATVQIGVTLVGAINSAFGANYFSPLLAPWFQNLPYVGAYSYIIAFSLLVILIVYLSLVFGELVPKSLALQHSESFALIVARPLNFFSTIFTTFTRFLTISSNLILKPFKDKTSFSETRLSPEEILSIVEEGVKAGTIEKSEHELIENILEINETEAREVMIPRVDVKYLAANSELKDFKEIINTYHSRLPVIRENLDDIWGILHIKDLMRTMAQREQVQLDKLVRPAFFVPETQKIGMILKDMQKRRLHMAIVVDEYGGTAGLLTMEDILEEIVGDIVEVAEDQDEQKIIREPDGSFLVAGSCSVIDFNEYFTHLKENSEVSVDFIELPESEAYASVAGYVIHTVGRFTEVGEKTVSLGLEFELTKRVRQKLVQFRLTPQAPAVTENEKGK